jgi:hypothetical protein
MPTASVSISFWISNWSLFSMEPVMGFEPAMKAWKGCFLRMATTVVQALSESKDPLRAARCGA